MKTYSEIAAFDICRDIARVWYLFIRAIDWTQCARPCGIKDESLLRSETPARGRSVLGYTDKLSRMERQAPRPEREDKEAETAARAPSHVCAARRYLDRLARFNNRTGLDDSVRIR